VESFTAGTLYLHAMKILAVFPHSNGCRTEVILAVLHCVLHDLFLCFLLFIAVHCVIHHSVECRFYCISCIPVSAIV